MYLIQMAIERAIESGDLRWAGWAMIGAGIVMAMVGTFRNQTFKVGYWRMVTTFLVIGITAMSGLLEEGLKIIAKLIGAGE